MYVILMAGGSGKRLWPLSNNVRAKQFLKAYQSDNSSGTMVAHVLEQIRQFNPKGKILVTTNEKKIDMLMTLLDETVDVCVEPEQRDTFPAISLALSYLKDVKEVSSDEVVIVCSVDIDASNEFFRKFVVLEQAVQEGASMALIGVAPNHPSNQFAYVLPQTEEDVCSALWYREKPTVEQAREYVQAGALWSGGVYAFKLKYMLERIHNLIDFKNYEDLYSKYSLIKKSSFAYVVAEGEKQIQIVRYKGEWNDLGNWKTYSQARMREEINGIDLNETCENVRVINELNIPILAIGCKNMIIAASASGILVSSMDESTNIKSHVNKMSQQVMYAERTWGSFLVIDIQKTSMTIKITLLKGHRMNYHSHKHRDEVWTIIEGNGKVIKDDKKYDVCVGDVIKIPAGCKHTIYAMSDLKIIETQLGKGISVEDKCIYVL